MSGTQIYLASRSPRRGELLRQIGVSFTVLEVAVDETGFEDLAARDRVLRLARDKARAGWRAGARTRHLPVLGADTLVVCGARVFGKPVDRNAALTMLDALSGAEHEVHTGVALVLGEECRGCVVSTRVAFRSIGAAEREAYWRSGEPAGKAGGYAIQGLGAVFVSALHGSYSAVVGLPLCETSQLLAHFGVDCLQRAADSGTEQE